MKLTAKQHRLRRVLRKNQNNIDAMGRDAGKISKKFTEWTVTGRTCDTMRNTKSLRVHTPDGTRYGKIQFFARGFDF